MLEWNAAIEKIAWRRAGVSLANGQINVRQGFSCIPSLIDNIPHVFLLKRNTSISGLAAPKSGSLGMLDAISASVLDGEGPESGKNNHWSELGSDWRTISSISSSSPASRAEKPKLSDLDGLEVHIAPEELPESADEGNKSDNHGADPGISSSPSEDSGVFSLNASRVDWLSSSTPGGVFRCGN